jgi:thioredoxin 1
MKKLFQLLTLVSLASVGLTSCDIPGRNKPEATPQQEAPDAHQATTRKAETSNIIYLHKQVTRYNSAQEAFDTITREGIVVVDFYADWCPPCRQLGSTIEQIAPEFQNVTFLKINVDEFKELSASIRSIPVLAFYKNGKEVQRVTGSKSKKELTALINSL